MKLRFNPLQVFKSSRTPAGLYARQKWLEEERSSRWQQDFQSTVNELLAGQSSDGSWGQSVIRTVRHLFGLHLTVRNQIVASKRGLDWLIAQASMGLDLARTPRAEILSVDALQGVPFSKGSWPFFLTGATLFLATVFGREDDAEILDMYEWLNAKGVKRKGLWCGLSCSNNVLRAFVVHPKYRASTSTILSITELARLQKFSGRWPAQVPFYQTVNALAHLDAPLAGLQVQRAFEKIYATQNKDGSWGRSQREWNAFLVLHALIKKKALQPLQLS